MSPSAITKVEQVTEAIESLVGAAIVCFNDPSARTHRGVSDARKEVTDALTAFLTPTLRVVADEKVYAVGDITKTLRHTVMDAPMESLLGRTVIGPTA